MPIGKLLFGSDPGAKSREALSRFGATGELGGVDVFDDISGDVTSQSALQNALQRQAAGQRNARSGLTGSGLGEDLVQNADLNSNDSLNRALTNLRLQILSSRLGALGVGAQTQRRPGLLETGGKIAAAKFLG